MLNILYNFAIIVSCFVLYYWYRVSRISHSIPAEFGSFISMVLTSINFKLIIRLKCDDLFCLLITLFMNMTINIRIK